MEAAQPISTSEFLSGSAEEEVLLVSQRLQAELDQLAKFCAAAGPSDACDNDAFGCLTALLDSCVGDLAKLNLWGESNRLLSSILWNSNSEILSRGWLQNRARTKPRGYAGDYELLRRVHENRLTDDPLGKLFDRYFQDQAAPQAVRNRMAMISQWIAERINHHSTKSNSRTAKIACFGSALGLEIRDAIDPFAPIEREVLHAVLVDIDPDAASHANYVLHDILDSSRLTTLTTNLFRLPQRASSLPELTDCDLLFCPGLFDYLNDKDATQMLRALYARLSIGGRLIVFQFAPHNPTRAYMEWFGNWYLTYRTPAEFQQLIADTALPNAPTTLGAEPLGINLFASIRRNPV